MNDATPTDEALGELRREVATRLGSLQTRTVGSGPVAILWSSMFVDSHTWDLMIPRLRAVRTLVLVDGPGLGLSEPLRRRTSIVEAADAARDLIDGLGIREPVDWLGNAFGGHVGFELAGREGVLRSLVAVSAPSQPIPTALRAQIVALYPVLRTLGPVAPVRNAIVGAMLTDASASDPEIRGIVVDSLRRPHRRSSAMALRSFILDRVDVTAGLSRITVPSLFVASDDRGDWSPADAESAARLVPSARAVTIAGARTLIPLEQPRALADEVLRFWDA